MSWRLSIESIVRLTRVIFVARFCSSADVSPARLLRALIATQWNMDSSIGAFPITATIPSKWCRRSRGSSLLAQIITGSRYASGYTNDITENTADDIVKGSGQWRRIFPPERIVRQRVGTVIRGSKYVKGLKPVTSEFCCNGSSSLPGISRQPF